jgi:hypothetical protein
MGTESLVVHANGPAPSPAEVARQSLAVAAALPLFVATPFLRRWHQRWGTTAEERAAVMPGDDLVPDCQYVINRAVTIEVPPAAVWPWLVQVGFGKAGFYSHDLLDNAGHRSADQILDEHQHPVVGDWVPMFTKVNETTAFRIAQIQPPYQLLWVKPDSTWAWRLRLVGTQTRLLTRLRIQYRWHRPAEAAFSLVLNEFGDFPMMRRMLLTLKARAEHRDAPPSN